jgi:hypothetical protein
MLYYTHILHFLWGGGGHRACLFQLHHALSQEHLHALGLQPLLGSLPGLLRQPVQQPACRGGHHTPALCCAGSAQQRACRHADMQGQGQACCTYVAYAAHGTLQGKPPPHRRKAAPSGGQGATARGAGQHAAGVQKLLPCWSLGAQVMEQTVPDLQPPASPR